MATPPGNKFKLYTSPAILAEVQEKLESKLQFERQLAVEYISRLKYIVTVVNPTQKLNVIQRDPDDNIILECAAGIQADIIVSPTRICCSSSSMKIRKFTTLRI